MNRISARHANLNQPRNDLLGVNDALSRVVVRPIAIRPPT
jgi:hypothetical protein